MCNWVVLKTLPSGVGLDSIVIGPTCQSPTLTNGDHDGEIITGC